MVVAGDAAGDETTWVSGLIVAVPLVDNSEMSVPNATSPAEVANGTRLTSR